QLARRLGRTPVLPDDGAVQRLAGRRVPNHRGFALVGDADGGETADAARLPDHLATGLQRRAPDLGRVMLDPARVRKMLRQLALADGGGAVRAVFLCALRASPCLRRISRCAYRALPYLRLICFCAYRALPY